MKALLTGVLILVALPACAGHPTVYAPAWGGRGLAVEARVLNDAAERLYLDLRWQGYGSEVRSRAHDLTRATHDFLHLAERRASYPRLVDAFQRVERREAYLERRLYRVSGYDGYGRPGPALRDVRRAMDRVGHTLQRWAFDDRGGYRGSFVYVPRYEFRFDYRYVYRPDRRYDHRQHDRRHDWRNDRRDDRNDGRRHERREDRRDPPHGDRRHDRRDGRNDDGRDQNRRDRRDDPDSRRDGRRGDRRQGKRDEAREDRREESADRAHRVRDPEEQVDIP